MIHFTSFSLLEWVDACVWVYIERGVFVGMSISTTAFFVDNILGQGYTCGIMPLVVLLGRPSYVQEHSLINKEGR